MKVLFLTEGGKGIGFGHVTRCISLGQAFKQIGASITFLVKGDSSVKRLFEGKNFIIFNWINKKELLYQKINHDVIVVDSYLAKKTIYDKLSQLTNGKLVMIDDYNRLNYPSGILINPSIYGEALNYENNTKITYLAGNKYVVLRKEFWRIPEIKIKKNINNILITLGGSNYSKLAYKIIKSFAKNSKLNFYVVDTKKAILKARSMIDLMRNADIAISGGGQTVYELARTGVPSVGICLAQNQKLNLTRCHRLGFLKFAGYSNSRTLLNKIHLLISKMDYVERIKMRRIGKQCVDGYGAKRVVKAIRKFL